MGLQDYQDDIVLASGIIASGTDVGAAVIVDSSDTAGGSEARIRFWRTSERGRIMVDAEDFIKFMSGEGDAATEIAAVRADRFELSSDLRADTTASRDLGAPGEFFKDLYVRRIQTDPTQEHVLYTDGSFVPEASGHGSIGTTRRPFASGTFDYLKTSTLSVATFADPFDVLVAASGDFGDLVTDTFMGARNADGFTDGSSTAGIQEAINDLPASGGFVVMQGHDYIVEDTIQMWGSDGTIRSNVVLVGKGPMATTIRPAAGSSNFSGITTSSGKNHQLIGFGYDGNRSSIQNVNYTTGINLAGSERVLVNDVRVFNVYGHGIELQDAKEPQLGRIQTFGNALDGISHKPSTVTPLIRCSGMVASHIFSFNNDNSGYDFSPPPDDSSFDYCRAYSNAQHGFCVISQLDAGIVLNLKFNDCVTHDNGTAADNNYHGFYVYTGADDAGVERTTILSDLSFSRCHAFSEYGDGFHIFGASGTANVGYVKAMNMDECFAFDNRRHGIWIHGEVKGGTLSNVTTYDNGTGVGNSRGIKVGAAASKETSRVTGLQLVNCAGYDSAWSGQQDVGISLDETTRKCSVAYITGYGNNNSDFEDKGNSNRIGILNVAKLGSIEIGNRPMSTADVGEIFNSPMNGFTVTGDIEPYKSKEADPTNPTAGAYAVGTGSRPFASGYFMTLTVADAGDYNFTNPDPLGNTTLQSHVSSSGIHQQGDFVDASESNVWTARQTFQSVVGLSGVSGTPVIEFNPASGTIQIFNQDQGPACQTRPVVNIGPSGITLSEPTVIPSGTTLPSGTVDFTWPNVIVNASGFFLNHQNSETTHIPHSVELLPSGFAFNHAPGSYTDFDPSWLINSSGVFGYALDAKSFPTVPILQIKPSGISLHSESDPTTVPSLEMSGSGLFVYPNNTSRIIVTHPVLEITPSGGIKLFTQDQTTDKLSAQFLPDPTGALKLYDKDGNLAGGFDVSNIGQKGVRLRGSPQNTNGILEDYPTPDVFVDADAKPTLSLRDGRLMAGNLTDGNHYSFTANWPNEGDFSIMATPNASGDLGPVVTEPRTVFAVARQHDDNYYAGVGGDWRHDDYASISDYGPTSTFHVLGSTAMRASGVLTNANTTGGVHYATDHETFIICSGHFSLLVGSAQDARDRIYIVKQLHPSGNAAISLTDLSADLTKIDHQDSVGVSGQYNSIKIVSDGTAWWTW